MAFVPRGHLPVKSAIRRMAQAWQASLGSARAEMQAILHSRSMLAYALEQSTGRMLEITSESWATDHALRWLKSGTCLLPNEDGKVRITTERFDMFYRAENAPIFIVEDDLHRLLGDHAPARSEQPEAIEPPPLSGKPLEPSAVEVLPEPTRPAEPESLEPKAWLAWARKEYPQQRNERPGAYIRRLLGLMQKLGSK
jgi:hypothetical protein